jgi:hypothetical protein
MFYQVHLIMSRNHIHKLQWWKAIAFSMFLCFVRSRIRFGGLSRGYKQVTNATSLGCNIFSDVVISGFHYKQSQMFQTETEKWQTELNYCIKLAGQNRVRQSYKILTNDFLRKNTEVKIIIYRALNHHF